MRIGVMLRAYDRLGGTGIYAHNIIKHLLKIDKDNRYILLYNDRRYLGEYSERENVEEVFIPRTNPIIWDQIQTPRIIKQYELDIIFNTKFTVPIATRAKKIMALHGASWFTHPELYKKFDILYVRKFMPIYCQKADFLISNSTITTQDFIRILKVPARKIKTVLLAAGDNFQPVHDAKILSDAQSKYRLPERFILTVTSYDPRKNFSTLFKAFQYCQAKIDAHLVVVGRDCVNYKNDFGFDDMHLSEKIHFPGWVDQKDLPALYNLADVFVFPSVYEEFGIPIVESMACGCPVVASNTGAIPELSNGAALLSDPFDAPGIGENILQILSSDKKASVHREMGLKRAQQFSWTKTAQSTLEIFTMVHSRQFQ